MPLPEKAAHLTKLAKGIIGGMDNLVFGTFGRRLAMSQCCDVEFEYLGFEN